MIKRHLSGFRDSERGAQTSPARPFLDQWSGRVWGLTIFGVFPAAQIVWMNESGRVVSWCGIRDYHSVRYFIYFLTKPCGFLRSWVLWMPPHCYITWISDNGLFIHLFVAHCCLNLTFFCINATLWMWFYAITTFKYSCCMYWDPLVIWCLCMPVGKLVCFY